MTVSVGIVVWCNGGRTSQITNAAYHVQASARCPAWFETSADVATAARWQAAQFGWTEREGWDYCPAHSDAGLAILEPRTGSASCG